MLSYVVVLTNSYNFAYIVIIYRDRVTTQEYMKSSGNDKCHNNEQQ